MYLSTLKHIVRLGVCIAMIVFILTLNVGVSTMSMPDADGHMHDCPFMGMATLCPMSPFEHIQAAQDALVSILPYSQLLSLLFALIALCAIRHTGLPRTPLRRMRAVSYRTYVTEVFDRFKEAFSDGILHRKEPGVVAC